jgi:hypothetical protein
MLWVELPNISNSGNTDYYLYYGNASGTDVSSGPNTFAFFDDFELGNLSRWATAQSGWSASTTYKNTGSYGGMCYGTVTSGQRMMETPGISGAAGQAYLVHCAKWDSNATASSDGNFYWGLPTATWSSATHTFYMGADGYSANRYYTGAAWAGWPTAVSISNSTWYFCELVLDIANQLFRFFHDTSSPVSTSKGTATAKDNGNTTVSTSASFNTVQVYETGNSTSYRGALDEYWVRKYYYTEPGWATPGSLEQRNSPRWMHYHKMRAQQN